MEKPLHNAELLALLVYTGTDAQGAIRKALREVLPTGQQQFSQRQAGPSALSWKWTILAIRHAVIKLAELPPSILYHGLNNVCLDTRS